MSEINRTFRKYALSYSSIISRKNQDKIKPSCRSLLLFTPWPGAHSNGIQPIEKSPLGEGLDARPITELAGRRAAGCTTPCEQ